MYEFIFILIGLQTIFILALFIFIIIYRIYLYFQNKNYQKKITYYYNIFEGLYLSYAKNEITEERFLAEIRKFDKTIIEKLLFKFIERNNNTDSKKILPTIFIASNLVDKYVKQLRSAKWWEQGIAAQKLGRMGASSAIPDLMDYTQTNNIEVNLATTWAIAKIDSSKAVNELIKALKEPDDFSPVIIKKMLIALGNQVLVPLLNALEDSNVTVQKHILEIIAHFDNPQIVPILINYLNHPNTELQISSIKSLGSKGAKVANNKIKELMNHERWEIRAMAAKALGQISSNTSLKTLEKGLMDTNWWVRLNSAESLLKIYPDGEKILQRTSQGRERFAADIARQVLATSHLKSI